MRYSMIEQLMLFKACFQAIHGYRSCECNSFASDVYDNLSDVAHFIVSDEVLNKQVFFKLSP